MILGCLADGMTVDDVLSEYDTLEREDVLAALEYAAELAQGRVVAIAPTA